MKIINIRSLISKKKTIKKRNLIKIAKAMGLNTQLFKDHDVLIYIKRPKRL